MEQELNLRSFASEAVTAPIVSQVHADLRPEDIVVDQVEPFGWCIRDGRFDEDDRSAVIGFIELDNDLFEVMQLGADFRLLTFNTLKEAVEHLANHALNSKPAA